MSNYLALSVQSRNAQNMRKRKLQSEIEDGILSGGLQSSGGSSEDSISDNSSSVVNYQTEQAQQGMSFGDAMLSCGGAFLTDKAVDFVVDKAKEKVANKVTSEVGEKALKKVGKELGEMGVKKGLKHLGMTAGAAVAGFLACPPVALALAAISAVNLIKDVGDLLFLADDLLNSIGIENELVEEIQSAWENFWTSVGDKASKFIEWARDGLHDFTGLKMFEDEEERAQRELREEKEEERKRINALGEKARALKRLAELQEKRKKKEKEEKEEEEKKKKINSYSEEDEEDKEDEEGEDKDKDEDEDEGGASKESESDNKGKLLNFLRKSGLLKGVLGSVGLMGGTLSIAYLLVGIYRVHYTGEFEYKGISAEYQSDNKLYQNFTEYDEDGNVVLRGLTKENKLVKTFYTKYSDKSYYAIVEDEEKFDDINDAYLRKNLLTPDELREQYPDIVDTNNKEAHFQLNPELLYTLDKYLHKDKVLYPQQFIKPVYYEENQENFSLKNLIDDESGNLLAESQVFADNGEPLKNSDGSYMTKPGIWDYGFAPVLRYKAYKVETRETTNGLKREVEIENEKSEEVVGKLVDEKPESGPVPEEEEKEKKSKKAKTSNKEKTVYIIDTAITPGGTVENKIEQNWTQVASATKSEEDVKYYSVKNKSCAVGGKEEADKEDVSQKEEADINEANTGSTSSSTDNMLNGALNSGSTEKSISRAKEEDSDRDSSSECKETYTVYKATDYYETITEENSPQYVGEPSTEKITGSKYFRDYMSAYSNYYPEGLPSAIDFRVLNNPEIQTLIYDDDPNALQSGVVNAFGVAATEAEFNNAVFMGDSITVGFKASKVIPDDRVFAKGGFTVAQGSKAFADSIIAKKPPVIVISYGTNDAGYGLGTFLTKYHDDYVKLINRFKTEIPGVKIYLNKIFPGSATHKRGELLEKVITNIPKYNEELVKIAAETGVTLIDCTNINNLQSYYMDAVHFKSSFYNVWLAEMKKQIVSGGVSQTSSNVESRIISNVNVRTGSDNNSSTNSNYNTNSGISSGGNLGSPMFNYGAPKLPEPREGEDRPLSDVLKFGARRDSAEAQGGLKWLDLATKYGEMYGIDPYIICAIISAESGGNPKASSSSRGLMGLMPGNNGSTFKAYNHITKTVESMTQDGSKVFDPEYNIKMGTLMLANTFEIEKYNVLMGMQGHNFGPYGIQQAVLYYLSGGTRDYIDFINVDRENLNAYMASGHVGWVTALYPGDLASETKAQNGHGYLDPNDGKHDAVCWYAQAKGRDSGQPFYLREVAEYYAGDGMPWIKDKEGNIITVDGALASSAGSAGGSNPSAIFNQYLASNWGLIEEKWDILFPGQSEIDEKLELVRKGDYTLLSEQYEKVKSASKKANARTPSSEENSEKDKVLTIERSIHVDSSDLQETDKQLVLNMTFALNQGNYLFMYDHMSEAEWKAMYTQLLSSPTGKTWDDTWIGFTKTDIFGTEDVGTLFPEDSGVNPVISVPYGSQKNIASDSVDRLTHYNYINFGIDVVVPVDTDVLTVADGVVTNVIKNGDVNSRFGNYVQIRHANGTSTITANLKDVKVKKGESIKKGDVIGVSGGNCASYKDNAVFYQIIHKGDLINPTWVITGKMTGFDDPIQGNNGVICQPVSNSSTVTTNNSYVQTALEQEGKPYVWGSRGPDSFDCSGLVLYSMKQNNINMSLKNTYGRTSANMRASTIRVNYENLQVGDLIFTHGDWSDLSADTSNDGNVTHVKIYIGNNQVVHASNHKKKVVKEEYKKRANESFGRYNGASGGSSSVGQSTLSSGCQTTSSLMQDSGTYIWPVPGTSRITAPFGELRDGNSRRHKGIDIAGPYSGYTGSLDVIASRGGEVMKTETSCPTNGYYGSKCGGGFGNFVSVKDSDNNLVIYAHLANGSISVKPGDVVSQGQKVGIMGNSGSSTGTHLHFEIRLNGESNKAVDPLKYVKPPS